MNGSISLKSIPGKGSTVQLVLQNVGVAAVSTLEGTQNVDSARYEFDKATLVVADDIEVNLELILLIWKAMT